MRRSRDNRLAKTSATADAETLVVETTPATPNPVIEAAAEAFRTEYPKNTETVTAVRKKTTRKTTARKKTTKSKKSS